MRRDTSTDERIVRRWRRPKTNALITSTLAAVIALSACGGRVVDAPPTTSQPARSETTAAAPGTTQAPPSTVTPSTTSTAPGHTPRYVTVRYRSDPVDIAHPAFDYLNTAGSSLVGGAWYDSSAGYMVINLSGTYYHYCGLPTSVWSSFRSASSFGSYYNASIKGRYGCEGLVVPSY